MMKRYLFVLLLLTSTVVCAQNKEVCITLDDLPVVNYGITEEEYLLDITRRLVATFDHYQIPAIGFVNEGKLYKQGRLDSARVNLLALWLQHGYVLGNHTYAHVNYHEVSFDRYTRHIIQGEEITRPLMQQYDRKLTYFRHPYLRIGQTQARHDSLRYFLKVHGYIEAPVTIDNDDYLFAKAFHVASVRKDTATMQQISRDYLRYMEDKLTFYEKASKALFGRNIKHILLLHANLLNAMYLDELAAMYQRRGYDFITLEKALTDEAYREEITRYSDWGISWIDRWALSRGKKDNFFAGDPETPDYIVKLSE